MARKASKKVEDVNSKIIEELLSKGDPRELFGKDGIFNQLKKQIVERVLESELDHELGYSKHSKIPKTQDNRRNGSYSKTILDDDGYKIPIEIPRDRSGEYSPKLIPKGIRRFNGFDDKVISLYSRGMTMSEIQGHLEEIYHTDVSKELISTVTDGVIEDN
jgi:putative transposase